MKPGSRSSTNRRPSPARARPRCLCNAGQKRHDPMRMPEHLLQPARARARTDGAAVNLFNSSNAVEILLLVGGLTLVPAMLFTVTGFTRILIVLGLHPHERWGRPTRRPTR